MRVLMVAANSERMNMPTLPLGAGCVVAAARAEGHEVAFWDLLVEEDGLEAFVRSFAPDVVALSVRNLDNQDMTAPRLLVEKAREVVALVNAVDDTPVVVGGAGFSLCPQEALEYLGAEMGIQGEGEVAFPELLRRLEEGEDLRGVPGLCLRGQGLPGARAHVGDLDSIPFPKPSLWDPRYVRDPDFWMPLQTRRGCALDCSYCATGTIEGRASRRRSPEKVVEIMARYAEAGFKRFYLTDNTFNLPRSYAMDLCRRLAAKGLGVSWRAIVYPWRVDEALAVDMARAGCTEVSIGFEHGCASMLRALNKKFTPKDIRRTVAAFASVGIRRNGFMLLGAPGETRETVEEGLAFADSLDLDFLKVTVGIRVYPGTALARTAVAEGAIKPEDGLLFPRFYLATAASPWIHERLSAWTATR